MLSIGENEAAMHFLVKLICGKDENNHKLLMFVE
jgi:hypothetical protein